MKVKSKKAKIALGALVLVAFAAFGIGVGSYYSPWVTLYRVKAALAEKNDRVLSYLIDWDAVRENLTRKLALETLRDNGVAPGDERAREVILAVEAGVEKILTPENVALAIDGGVGSGMRSEMKVRGVYMSVGYFLFAIQNQTTKSAVAIRLKRKGPMSWQIDEVMPLDSKLLE